MDAVVVVVAVGRAAHICSLRTTLVFLSITGTLQQRHDIDQRGILRAQLRTQHMHSAGPPRFLVNDERSDFGQVPQLRTIFVRR